MDKIDGRSVEGKVEYILRWLNAHAEREALEHRVGSLDELKVELKAPTAGEPCAPNDSCPVCPRRETCSAYTAYIAKEAVKPPIEQELEAELYYIGNGHYGVKSAEGVTRCTFILLPDCKYGAWARGKEWQDSPKTFYDIPVYSYSGDEIKYCTD